MRGKMVEEREQCLKKCCAKFTLFGMNFREFLSVDLVNPFSPPLLMKHKLFLGGQETSKQLYCLIEKCKEDIDNFKVC